MNISIIIPIYNVSQYVKRCLTSVVNQTTQENIECICVDDCGTDNSMEIVENFVKNTNSKVIKFKLLYHKTNKGLSGARNTGIKNATGNYIYLLDSDDEITPTCIEDFLKIIHQHPQVDLIQGLFIQDSPYMNQFKNKRIPSYTEDRKYIKEALLDYNAIPICAANKMVRRELIIQHNLFFKEGIIHEDNYWSFFLAKHVQSFACNSKSCYIYFVNPNSIMTAINVQKESLAYKTIIQDFIANLDPFLLNKQKETIFYLLHKAFQCNYIYSTTEKKQIFTFFSNKCSILERFVLRFWFYKPLSAKRTHLVIKTFNL